MAHHSDLICKLSHVANSYDMAGDDWWWENQGLSLDSEPDWPGDSIMLVSWPEHVAVPRFNSDCTISGPYADLAEAQASARSGAEIMPDLEY